MRFEWDEGKNRKNLAKHGIRFETAALVFEDPHQLVQRDDRWATEERWITMGVVDPGAVVVVIHNWFEMSGKEVIRIISARAAESHEKRAYEEAYEGTKAGYQKRRRKNRR